ncbi:hypothetical protein PSTT_01360 [Puccinia striiformis]|uniref:Uncharacterized protein n=1 Tax=Puccinia striiformis TaxID=27350 RepID=A0A2S4W478_9BASI|nr:hypothetical protein PSTT_01360 [Puccinia striiformis]
MKGDLRHLSTAHNLKGFLVLVSRDPNSTLLVTGGSLLGEQFVAMMAKKKPNPCLNFYLFVSGQVAIQETTGVAPPPPIVPTTPKEGRRYQMFEDDLKRSYDKGKKADNCRAVCELLGNALADATHGEHNVWPGTDTALNLKKWNIELRVKNNFKGITPDQNESDARTSAGVKSGRTIVQAGRRLKRSTTIQKKPPRASKKTANKTVKPAGCSTSEYGQRKRRRAMSSDSESEVRNDHSKSEPDYNNNGPPRIGKNNLAICRDTNQNRKRLRLVISNGSGDEDSPKPLLQFISFSHLWKSKPNINDIFFLHDLK